MSIVIYESEQQQSFIEFWDPIKDVVLNGVGHLTSVSYGPSIDEFLQWWYQSGETNPIVATTAYRKHLSETRGLKPATVNKKLSALRKLFEAAAVCGIGKNDWPLSFEVSTAIKGIKNIPQHGSLHGTRLAKSQLEALIRVPDGETLLGRRDRAILAILVGCGLRRSEVVNLTWGHLTRDGDVWIISDLIGKHGRIRSPLMPKWVYDIVIEYSKPGKSDEHIVVSYNRHGQPRGKITAQSIYRIVVESGKKIGLDIVPHDLRRSNARFLRDEGAEIEDIQHLLGHSETGTTDKYIGRTGDMSKLERFWEGFGENDE